MEEKREIVTAKVCVICGERRDVSEGELIGIGWICSECLDRINAFLEERRKESRD